MLTNFTSITSKNFLCSKCHFKCCKKGDWNRHILSSKHQNVDKMLTNVDADVIKPYICECGKVYKHRQSLYVHKQTCITKDELNKELHDKDLIDYLLKENSEFKELLMEQNKMVMKMCENSSSSITNSNINSHNKTFNLNVFLNEHCKDAMNIMDFVDSLKLQVADLESVGKLGFVEGISNIIVKNLKAMDIHKRPVHCSDSKREVMYIKDENKWEKEDEEKKKLRKAIKRIACKNQRLIPVFKEAHPDCIKAASKFSDQYNKMIIESMGGSGNEDFDNENKIIKKIAKEVTINKTL